MKRRGEGDKSKQGKQRVINLFSGEKKSRMGKEETTQETRETERPRR